MKNLQGRGSCLNCPRQHMPSSQGERRGGGTGRCPTCCAVLCLTSGATSSFLYFFLPTYLLPSCAGASTHQTFPFHIHLGIPRRHPSKHCVCALPYLCVEPPGATKQIDIVPPARPSHTTWKPPLRSRPNGAVQKGPKPPARAGSGTFPSRLSLPSAALPAASLFFYFFLLFLFLLIFILFFSIPSLLATFPWYLPPWVGEQERQTKHSFDCS